MIVLGNQLALQFAIGDQTDFISIECFRYMRIAENAGGLRPIINLTFTVKSEAILPFLNSGNLITIMYGIKEPTSDVIQFEIMGDDKTKNYRVGSTVSLLGALYNRGFTSQKKSFCYEKKKSFEALKMLVENDGLKFVTNTNIKTNDLQNWYQSGITDWRMSSYIADRAYLDNSTFFVYGFDNRNYYFLDLKEHLKSGVKWYFTVNDTSSNENSPIVNIATYKCDDANAGVNAQLAGQNITDVGYNIDTGELLKPQYQLKTFTTMGTNNININSTGCVDYQYHITTNDEHSFAIEAKNQNFRNNVLFSSYTCHVPVTGQYRDFRLFDVVQLIPSDSDRDAEGIYFITGIAKEYKDMQYTTLLTLNRESANGIKGDLEDGV